MSALEFNLCCPGDQDFELRLAAEVSSSGVTAVYGPSGSGKSTLLDCLAGLRRAGPGSEISFQGEAWQADSHFTPPWQRDIGYVFQDARLFPHLSVAQNLAYASSRSNNAMDSEQVIHWLDLEPLLRRSPEALSGGQKQRVAIGRALLSGPRLLLLDEPLANLDDQSSRQCLNYLQRLATELALPMLYVSHDMEEVSELADQLLLLDDGELVGHGSLLSLCSRLDTRLSHEEHAAAIALGKITGHDEEFQLTELELEGHTLYVNHLPQSVGQQRRVRIPARDVSICRERPHDSSILNILPVTLVEIEQSPGARVLLRLALGSQHLLARITRKSASRLDLKVGDEVYAQIKSAALLSEATDAL